MKIFANLLCYIRETLPTVLSYLWWHLEFKGIHVVMWIILLVGISLSSSITLLELPIVYFFQKSCKVSDESDFCCYSCWDIPSFSPCFCFLAISVSVFSQHRARFHCEALIDVSCLIQPWENYTRLLFLMPPLPLSQHCFLSSILTPW